jgi:hypothetical protein
MPMVTNFSCDANTVTMGVLDGYIGRLSDLLVSASQVGTNGVGSSKQYREGLAVGGSTCALAKSAATNCWFAGCGGFGGDWVNTSSSIFVEEFTGHPGPFPGPGADAALYATRGSIYSDLTAFATNGSAQPYLKPTALSTNGMSNNPPTTPNGTWQPFASASPGVVWVSQVLPSGSETNGWFPEFTLDCPTVPETRIRGWQIDGQVLFVSPQWQYKPSGSCQMCTVPMFHIVGPDTVCVGSSITLTALDGQPPYVWMSSNTNKATVAGSGDQGTVTGISASLTVGDVTISVTGTNGCLATYPITVIGTDLDISGVSEPEEEYPGAVLVRNYDNNQAHRKMITIQKVLGSWTNRLVLTRNNAKVDVYTSSSGGNPLSFTNGIDNIFDNSACPKNLWVEGVTASDSTNDVVLTVSPEGSPTCNASDSVRFTVLWVDVSGKFSSSENIAADNSCTNTFYLISTPHRTSLGSGQFQWGMGWACEFTGTVHPTNFVTYVVLDRDGDCRTFTNSTVMCFPRYPNYPNVPPGSDSSSGFWVDTEPQSNNSGGHVYDIDIPGIPTDLDYPTNSISRSRCNFKEFAIYNDGGNLVRCSLFYDWFCKVSYQKQGQSSNGHVTSSSSTTLTDNSQNWETDQWKDGSIAVENIENGITNRQYRIVTGNTASSITVNRDWYTQPSWPAPFHTPQTNEYYILNASNTWTVVNDVTNDNQAGQGSISNLTWDLQQP